MEFVYTTYIKATPEKVWDVLTQREFTKQYFFGQNINSDWERGSTVTFTMGDGDTAVVGKVLEVNRPEHLSYTWTVPGDDTPRENPTYVIFKLKQVKSEVKLTLWHKSLVPTDITEREDTFYGLNNGWPAILSNLKTLLETGEPLDALKF
ncbi:SRPBCC family protein [Virgibacillus kekensis]|uniref:SRPBCC family protein n=1 Tax=Virgibacillus kekensis TaxID=202261 RepID=A0ABV9DKW6_9BACI